MGAIKRAIQSLAGRFGYCIVRNDKTQALYLNGLDAFLANLKRLGFAPRHIIDVGANKGIWTWVATQYFPDAQYTLVEPQDHLRLHVQHLIDRGYKIQWINAGLGDRPGSLPFAIASRDDSSSFALPPARMQSADVKQINVQVRTLNEIAASCGAPPPEMVKIDAEGFDLKVLDGAAELLGKTEIFLVEAVICAPDFENTIARVIQKMSESGYRVMDITDLNRSPKSGLLWLCELAFVRNDSRLLAGMDTYE